MRLRVFNGEVPRLPADRLPEGYAALARNCDFAKGELRSLKGLGVEHLADPAARPVRGLFTDNGIRFFAWNKPTRAYLAPTIDDTVRRVYYQTHDAGVRVAQTDTMKTLANQPGPPTESWAVGVTAPAAPSVVVSGTGTGDLETVALVLVAINIWGEESAPSPPVTVERSRGQTIEISVTHAPTTGQVPLQGLLVYRTYPSTQSSDYYLLQETAFLPTTGNDFLIEDTSVEPQSSVILESADWDLPPPDAGNLSYPGNGFFCVSLGKDLIFSEPYRPHAWPYRMTFPAGVVGVIEIEGGVLVTTQKGSYMVLGSSPEQMTQQFFPVKQAGVSDTAIAHVDGSAVYATNDGLADIFGGQPSISTSQSLFLREDWRARYRASLLNMRLAAHDGRVLALIDPTYPIAASGESFLLKLDEAEGALSRLAPGTTLYSAVRADSTDTLYVGTATGFAEFEGGVGGLSMTWQSATIRYAAAVAFAAGRIICTGTIQVEVLAAGVVRHTETFAGGDHYFKLPDIQAETTWAVRFTGVGTVQLFDLGMSFAGLRNNG